MIHSSMTVSRITTTQVDFDFKVPSSCTRVSFLVYNQAEDVEITGVVVWDTTFKVKPDNEQGMLTSHRGLAIAPWDTLYISPAGNAAARFGEALGYLTGGTPLCLRIFLSDLPSGGSLNVRAHWS